jgi:hypothetical protein
MGFETYGCDFKEICEVTENMPEIEENFVKEESRAILTIVDNKTIEYKNQKILSVLRYKTGLMHEKEREELKEKVLLKGKQTYLENTLKSQETHILYQTKKKIEGIPLSDKKRLVELVGHESYDEYFGGLEGISYADVLRSKMNCEGIEGLKNFLDKIQ